MRIKPIITLTASATLVAGMSLFVAMLPVGMPFALTNPEKQKEETSLRCHSFNVQHAFERSHRNH